MENEYFLTSCFTTKSALIFIIRVILGILFLFQGYDKLFKIKVDGVAKTFKYELGEVKLPFFLLISSAWYTSVVEFVCGLLLIIGLFKNYALLLLGIDLIMVVSAFSLIKPLWDMKLVFPRLVLLCALLYFPSCWDVFSIDYILFCKTSCVK